jgi:nicotinamidase-related amidase
LSGKDANDSRRPTIGTATSVTRFSRAALLIVDVQKGIDAAYHAADGPRNNPEAEQNIARLLAAWRRDNRPIIHIRHDSTFPASAYRPGQEGNNFKAAVVPAHDETVIPKRTIVPLSEPNWSVHCAGRELMCWWFRA